MRNVTVLLACLIGVTVALEMECPRPEWKQWRLRNTCYWFEEDRLPQYKADERCRRYDGKLVKIDDQAENDWLHKWLQEVVPPAKGLIGGSFKDYYIGLKRDGDTNWKWEVDGTDLDPTWGGYWQDGEPNDYHNKENCVTLYEDNGKWNDVMCGDDFYFICEYQIPPQP